MENRYTSEGNNAQNASKKAYAVGLDIGTTKCVIVVGSVVEGSSTINIEAFASTSGEQMGVNAGTLTNVDKAAKHIKKVIEDAEAQLNGAKISHLSVGISGIGFEMRDFEATKVFDEPTIINHKHIKELKEKAIASVMVPPGYKIVQTYPTKYELNDKQRVVNDAVGEYAHTLKCKYLVCLAQNNQLDTIRLALEKAKPNITIVEFVPQGVASGAAVLSEEELQEGVAVLDIGGGTSDLAVFKDEMLTHTVALTIGGNIVTNDISMGLGVTERHAEELKKKGSAITELAEENTFLGVNGINNKVKSYINKRDLSYIIEERFRETFEIFLEEIKACELENTLKRGGIVVTGGGAEQEHLTELLSHVTGFETRLGAPSRNLEVGKFSQIRQPKFATALGIVLHHLHNHDPRHREIGRFLSLEAGKNPKTNPESTTTQAGVNAKVEGKTSTNIIANLWNFGRRILGEDTE